MKLTKSGVLADARRLPTTIVTTDLAAALRGPSYAPVVATCGPYTLYVLRLYTHGRWRYRGYAVEARGHWVAGDPDHPVPFEAAAGVLMTSYSHPL